MKKMTCRQLGGACDKEFHAQTFDEIHEMSKSHGMEMFQKNDKDHLDAMHKMSAIMKSSDSMAMKEWMDNKRNEFNSLPEFKN